MPRVKKPKAPQEPRSRQASVVDPAEASGTAVDFWELVKSISRADWDSGWQTYLYRTWPRIDRRDGEHFIAKIKEDFDEEFLMRNWGTGKYYLRINNASGQTVASKAVSVYDVNYPPKVNPEEILAGDPANERYFAAWGKKDADRDRSSDSAEQGNNSPVLRAVSEFAKITQQLLERGSGLQEDQRTMLRAAHDESLRLVVDQAKADARPPDSLGMLEKILVITDKLRPETPPPVAAAPDPIAMFEKFLGIMEKLHPAPAAPEGSPVDQLSALLDLSEKLEGRFAKGTGDSSSSTAKIIMEALPEVLKQATVITGNIASIAATRARGAPAASGPAAVVSATAPSPGPDQAHTPGPVAVLDPQQILNENLRRTIARMLLLGDSGEEAAVVAEKTNETWAAEFATLLRTNPAALAADPIFAPALASPRLPDFVAEYLGYFEPEPEGGEAPEKTDGASQ